MPIPFYKPAPAPPGIYGGQPLPEAKASTLSRVFFHWVTPIMRAGYSRPLEADDLWALTSDLECKAIANQLQSHLMDRTPPSKRLYTTINNGLRVSVTSDPSQSPPEDAKHRFSERSSRAYVKQARESMAFMETVDEYAVQHSSIHLQSVYPSESRSPPSRALDDRAYSRKNESAKEENKEQRRKHGKSKAKKIEAGKLVVEGGKAYDMSLIRAGYSTVWWSWWKAVFCKGCAAGLQITAPLITKLLIDQLTLAHDNHADPSTPPPKNLGYVIGLAFALFVMVQSASLFNYQALQRGSVIGFMMRAALIDLIGRKSMRLSSTAKAEMTAGKLTTMVSADASFLDFSAPMTLDLVVQPVQILVGLGLLIWTLGYSALVGLAVLALAGPVQAYMFTRMMRTRQSQLQYVDGRVRLLGETITAIRSVKLFAYVSFFSSRVADMRKNELVYLRRNGWNRATMNASMAVIPTLAAVLTFVAYGLSGHELNAASIFSGLQYFNVLKVPISFLPMCFTAVSDALVGIGRISQLLRAEEISATLNIDPAATHAIDVQGDFQFERVSETSASDLSGITKERCSEQDKPFVLRYIDLRIPRGALVCIVGRVGTGKSALLAGLLGDMKQSRGHAIFGGSVSYVPQQAWIHSGSLRDNITFSAPTSEIDLERLKFVQDACALRNDIDGMVQGDLTNVGEKGLLLSGGQRQRLSLARAAYSDSSIVLLDDPLSAVDANVSHHILKECILSGPLVNRTRIMVTHQLDVLPKADLILVMDRNAMGEGMVVQQGTYDWLKAQEGPFKSLIAEHGNQQTPSSPSSPATPATKLSGNHANPSDKAKEGARGVMEEDRPTGAIPWSVYTAYFRAMGSWMWPIVFGGLLVLTQLATVANSLWLGWWSAGNWRLEQGVYMGVYGGELILRDLLWWGASYSMFVAGLRASYALFARAWEHVMRAPVKWHDQTPVSLVSPRSVRLQDVQRAQQHNLAVRYRNALAAVGTFGLILYTYPYLGLAFIPLCFFYYIAGSYYTQVSREVKRIDSITRSQIYSSFGEQASADWLAGLSVIRAFGKQGIFEDRMQRAINVEGPPRIMSYRWLGVRLDLSSNLLILLIAIFGILFRHSVDPAEFGVVFSYALAAASLFSNLVSLTTPKGSFITRHYLANLLPLSPPSWPSRGSMSFRDLSLRYSKTGPWVLKGLNFNIGPGEKIGVIGRTGAGKSSLVAAIMRMVPVDGKIEVDGVDLGKVGIDTIRSRIGIIPQDAFLFEGTVRENLDPLSIHSDSHLSSLLSLIHADPFLPSTQSMRDKFKLDATVSNEGSNFSAGEKQLLALIRALARKTKVLILDEATSSVDPETDALIQRIIQNHLKGVTLISIAHRLQTVVYYDRILVLDQGKVAEVSASSGSASG
ncbi:cadmium ion transporter [Kwoniella heveanensis BCC8398]|uniref:Cadmium ion transporter n=1 Tax=Kwoniella heveanensis BCC8398 TaxID=1296120 RepID=A0A1B9GTQ2_9TREE|nr:cadmium ion transporter [Kwoniella heveanensis BCC8398]